MAVEEIFAKWVNGMTPDLGALYDGSHGYALSDWKLQQNSLVTGSGALAVAVPGFHLAGLAADVAFVLNRMGVASYGVGAILGHQAGCGNLLEKADFPAVLSYWAGDEDFKEAMTGKASASLSSKVGLKLSSKVLGTAAAPQITAQMLSSSGYLVGQKFAGKAAAKAAAKFGAKFGGKALAGWVPILGPVVGGGVNLWLLSSIIDAAEDFYGDKIKLIERLVDD